MNHRKHFDFRREGGAPLVGLSTEKTGQLWHAVRDNTRRLDTCPGPHQFAPVRADRGALAQTPQTFATDHRCTVCGGVLDLLAVRWYERGLAHARDQAARK